MLPSNGIILVRGESGVLMIPSSAGLATDLSIDDFSSALAFPTTREIFISDTKIVMNRERGLKVGGREKEKQTHKRATRT